MWTPSNNPKSNFSDTSSVKPRKIDFVAKNKQNLDPRAKFEDRTPFAIVSQNKRQPVKREVPALKSNELFNKYPLKRSKEN